MPSPQPEPPARKSRPLQHARIRRQLTSLAIGETGVLQTWLLRRHLKQCESCRREWEATQGLLGELRAHPLPIPARSAPEWPVSNPLPARHQNADTRNTITLGGITMQKRTAIAALGVVLFAATGAAFATGKFLYNPFRDSTDAHGHVLRADSQFSGEVKLYDRDNRLIGSFGKDGAQDAPVVATVNVDGKTLAVSGPGRHPLRVEGGEVVGYADLIPETAAERARWKAAHEQALGHEETLPISSGCDDGWGTAIGYFGSEQEGGLLTWRFTGVGVVKFLHNGKIVHKGIATRLTDSEATHLRQTMRPEEFQAKVRVSPPPSLVFEWTTGGITRRHTGIASMPLTLPDGSTLTVQFSPEKAAAR